LWSIFINQGTILVRVVAGEETEQEEYAFAIQVVDRHYALSYSAGFAFVGVRDDEYRLDPSSTDSTRLTITRNGSGGVPYQLSAFTHYTTLTRRKESTRALSASFGVASKVPVNELTAMLGGTFSLNTLPLVNAGHITVGVAYAPRKVLTSDYRGVKSVPVGTSAAGLTTSKYGFGAFVAITFSFLGGEEQFRGVYSGKGSTNDK
jgi:hypothetical protein